MNFAVKIFVLLATFSLANSASSTWGVRNSTDTILLTKNVFRPAIASSFQTVFFDIPESYQSNNKMITAIYLHDQFQNSSGPVNSLIYGGPDWSYASVQMRTGSSIGLNVTFIVYGR